MRDRENLFFYHFIGEDIDHERGRRKEEKKRERRRGRGENIRAMWSCEHTHVHVLLLTSADIVPTEGMTKSWHDI